MLISSPQLSLFCWFSSCCGFFSHTLTCSPPLPCNARREARANVQVLRSLRGILQWPWNLSCARAQRQICKGAWTSVSRTGSPFHKESYLSLMSNSGRNSRLDDKRNNDYEPLLTSNPHLRIGTALISLARSDTWVYNGSGIKYYSDGENLQIWLVYRTQTAWGVGVHWVIPRVFSPAASLARE